jgi:hypothetical protein
MNKESMKKYLIGTIPVKDPVLSERMIDLMLVDYDNKEFTELPDWEQLRYVRRRNDDLWKMLKYFSERVLIKNKVKKMIESMPRPKGFKR